MLDKVRDNPAYGVVPFGSRGRSHRWARVRVDRIGGLHCVGGVRIQNIGIGVGWTPSAGEYFTVD
jgi:hypothetical protein